jgi:preprotein translocase subunit SecD
VKKATLIESLLISLCFFGCSKGGEAGLDPGAAAESSKPAMFQLRLVVENPSYDTEELTLNRPIAGRLVEEKLYVQKKPLLDGPVIKSATAEKEPVSGDGKVSITLTPDGAKRIAEITRDHIGERLAFGVDGKIYSAPKVLTPIKNGIAMITGLKLQEARQLATRLNAAASK